MHLSMLPTGASDDSLTLNQPPQIPPTSTMQITSPIPRKCGQSGSFSDEIAVLCRFMRFLPTSPRRHVVCRDQPCRVKPTLPTQAIMRGRARTEHGNSAGKRAFCGIWYNELILGLHFYGVCHACQRGVSVAIHRLLNSTPLGTRAAIKCATIAAPISFSTET
jgi:hypothetical protein